MRTGRYVYDAAADKLASMDVWGYHLSDDIFNYFLYLLAAPSGKNSAQSGPTPTGTTGCGSRCAAKAGKQS